LGFSRLRNEDLRDLYRAIASDECSTVILKSEANKLPGSFLLEGVIRLHSSSSVPVELRPGREMFQGWKSPSEKPELSPRSPFLASFRPADNTAEAA